MHPFVGCIPKVPYERVQAKRISAQNVAAFLETVPALIKDSPEQAGDAAADVMWMKEVNLERATMAHREFRKKRSAADLAMLDVVDMGRAFPAPPSQTDIAAACSSQTPSLTTAIPGLPLTAPAAPTPLKITPHASPSTELTSPRLSTLATATPAELCAGPATASGAEGGGEESATCDAVTRSDFIKLLGYDGKKPATPTHPRWWSSPMDPLRRSSSHVSTASFSQGPANLGPRTRSLGSALDVSDGAASSMQDAQLQPPVVLITTPLNSDRTLGASRDTPSPAPASGLARAPPSATRHAILGRLDTIVSPTGASPMASGGYPGSGLG